MRRGPRISLIPSGICCCRWMRLDGRASFGDWPWATTRTGTRHERKSRYSSISNWAGRLPRIRMARCRCCSARDLTSADPQTARLNGVDNRLEYPSDLIRAMRPSAVDRPASATTNRTGYLQRRLWSLGSAVSVYRLRFVQRGLDHSARPAIPPGVPALPTGHAARSLAPQPKSLAPLFFTSMIFCVPDIAPPGEPADGRSRRHSVGPGVVTGSRGPWPVADGATSDELSDHRAITTRGSPATASGGLAERESPQW